MSYLKFLLLIYAFLAVFIAGGLFFQKSGKAYTYLSIFLILFGLEMLEYLYSTSRVLVMNYPTLYGRWYFVSGFLYGPVLLFHFRSLFHEKKIEIKDLLHFIPAIAAFTYYSDIWLMSDLPRLIYMSEHFKDRLMPINYARATHILIYGLIFIILINRNYNEIPSKQKLYAVTFCSLYFITAVLVSWLTEYASDWNQFIIYYIVSSSIVFVVGFILYREPEFLSQITKKYLSSSLLLNDMKRIQQKMIIEMEEKQVFLKRDLTITKLAEIIDEKPHNISQTLSGLLGESFNDFVNGYRIQHSKKMLSSQEFSYYKIEAIAIESGFNNKVTFNKAFSKFANETPSQYRNRVFDNENQVK